MSVKEVFDQHVSLFALPLVLGSLSFLVMKLTADKDLAMLLGVCFVVSIIVILFSGVFILQNGLLLQWRMNWLKNLALSASLFLISALFLILLINAGSSSDMPTFADSLAQKLLLPDVGSAASVAACSSHADCELPMAYAVQSNCPFEALCVDGSCAVVCPVYDTGIITEDTSLRPCDRDGDCDCSWRGEKVLECRCVDGGCYSVEDLVTVDI